MMTIRHKTVNKTDDGFGSRMKGKCSVMQEDRTFLEIEKLCKENGFYNTDTVYFAVKKR